MYIPNDFHVKEHAVLLEVMRANPFATVVTSEDSGFVVNHTPLIVTKAHDNNFLLKGHIAKANNVWKTSNAKATAIFHGPNAYVSPNTYPTKKEHGKVVPTWNYVAVHAAGPIQFMHDVNWKIEFLNQLTNIHEASQPMPWSVSDAPEEFTERLMGGIVGFEIAVEALEGKWKLSQNQPAENYKGVISALSKSNDPQARDVASIMSGRKSAS
jgi:transcriptional regulator